MSLESPFQLKQTNVSRPRLSHSESQQSIAASQAASDGYYSLSENSSNETDARRPRYATSPSQYRTPPSQYRTPAESHEHLQNYDDAPIASLRGVGVQRHPPPTTDRPVSTIAEERPDTQATTQRPMDSESMATTPGLDTTPYIRFAIDQLTRDEEVRGSRMYPQGHEDAPVVSDAEPEDETDYPVERIVSDDSLGYMDQNARTQERLSRHMPQRQSRQAPHTKAGAIQEKQPYRERTPEQAQKDVFVAHDVPHAPLNFVPGILRPLWLLLFTFICLLMLAALIFCAIYSNRQLGIGLWDYRVFGDNRYFVFEYLPTLLGALILLWLIQVQVALQRVVPFIAMASGQYRQRSEAIFLQLYPTQFLFPRIEYFRAGQPVIGVCFFICWVFQWTIPLLASSFNVRYDLDRAVWRWVAVQGVIWTVVVLYILLVLSLLVLLVLLRKPTGLKWDPRSLADIVALLERSNITNEYRGAETFEKRDFDNLRGRSDRLGYWSTTRRPNDIFHGIGEEGIPTRRYSIEDGRIREKGGERTYPDTADVRQSHHPSDFSIRMDIRSPSVRLRYLPWWLRTSAVLLWIVTAMILLIAFLVISFVNSAVRLGFLPQVFARTNAAGFSASNFLYSFIPALIGHILFLIFLTFDYTIRVLRPYISLASNGGATAETSLLVDYASRLPLSATFAALENQHYQTAILSLVSLFSLAIPVLAGGCFWTQYYPNSDVVRVAAELPGFYALCFFLALYGITLLALWPSRRRAALPHRSTALAEIISWVYQSPLLTDRSFSRPHTKPELVARLMGSAYAERSWAQSVTSLVRPSRDNLREQSTKRGKRQSEKADVSHPGKTRYGFGIHVGRDGLEHLGIDRLRRGGERSGREMVIWEEQQRKSLVSAA
ncbi:hypothetical protein PMIN06_009333 [Paraphaeosphaeria minitans]|uniref:Phosphoribosylaminoimidazole-succinocarboxamide synthase n=1 Tax=Paraphaeosphaeria minitans TaxID=565426 RepID=A0A9P6GGZ2_9PLEO|nr:phosphoribosylaminoimidazole-succinocarboxamide synthase [Paraphaeosphaeria minitans]